MKKLIVFTGCSIFCFLIGFYTSEFFLKKNKIEKIQIPVNEYGYNTSLFCPIEYHVFMRNWTMKEYLRFRDSLFFNALSNDFYLDISIAKKGSNSLLKKEGNYYECVVFSKERKKYSFDDFYLITPDTIYRIILKPLRFQFDTIRPIRQEN